MRKSVASHVSMFHAPICSFIYNLERRPLVTFLHVRMTAIGLEIHVLDPYDVLCICCMNFHFQLYICTAECAKRLFSSMSLLCRTCGQDPFDFVIVISLLTILTLYCCVSIPFFFQHNTIVFVFGSSNIVLQRTFCASIKNIISPPFHFVSRLI